jgi:hypothetical protein
VKKKTGFVLAVCWMMTELSAPAATTRYFTGAGGDNNFSTAANWDTAPVAGDNICIHTEATTALNPAVWDAGFTADLSTVAVNSTNGATGDSYMEVASGVDQLFSNLQVGTLGTGTHHNYLTLKTGSTLANRYANGGATVIGADAAYRSGQMTLEPGVSFQTAVLTVNDFGTLTYEFGVDSVSTLMTSRTTAGGANTIDGLIQVDLSALTAAGTYTLINSSSTNLLIGGTMRTWLDGAGGSSNGTGDFTSANFEVLNGGTNQWSVELADNNQDLIFSLNGIPDPEELDASVRDMATVISFSALPASLGGIETFSVGAGGGESFLIDLSEVRSIDYVQLRKQFWMGDVPADLELAIYTGSAQTIPEIARSTNDWQVVATLIGDNSNSEKVFSFPTASAQFLKITILRTENYGVSTDVSEIIVGSGANVVNSDTDGDKVSDWDEMVAGTDPYSTNSVPRAEFGILVGTPEMVFTTSIGRLYAVQIKTNLLGGAWMPLGDWVAGSGTPMSILDTNIVDQMFYRLKTIWP